MSREREHYSAEGKVAILHKHLVEKVAVSQVGEEHGLSPNVFYRWQKESFENGAAACEVVDFVRRWGANTAPSLIG